MESNRHFFPHNPTNRPSSHFLYLQLPGRILLWWWVLLLNGQIVSESSVSVWIVVDIFCVIHWMLMYIWDYWNGIAICPYFIPLHSNSWTRCNRWPRSVALTLQMMLKSAFNWHLNALNPDRTVTMVREPEVDGHRAVGIVLSDRDAVAWTIKAILSAIVK